VEVVQMIGDIDKRQLGWRRADVDEGREMDEVAQ